MKGGVSSTMGSTGEGMVDDVMLLDEVAQTAQDAAERLEQFGGGRMVVFQIVQDLLRGTLGIDLGGDFAELGLVAAQILVADFEQAVERDIDHFVVQQLLAISVGADAEVAVGARQ